MHIFYKYILLNIPGLKVNCQHAFFNDETKSFLKLYFQKYFFQEALEHAHPNIWEKDLENTK